MSPILGIYASSMQPALNATSYESIATVTVGAGGSSSIDFTSIASTYKHLQIRGILRLGTGTSGSDNLYMRFNSDSGSNYSRHDLLGDGTNVLAEGSASQTAAFGGRNAIPRSGVTASVFGAFVIDILDYANTNKYKTIRSLTGFDMNGVGGQLALNSGLWQSTSAITSVSLFDESSGSFAQYSSFALYGVRG